MKTKKQTQIIQQQLPELHTMDNTPLMSNNQVINHGPDKITIDFMGGYPQFNTKTQPTLVVNHKIIILDPYTAKNFLIALQSNLQRYEQTYGTIEKPEQVIKFEKMSKKEVVKITSGATQDYMG